MCSTLGVMAGAAGFSAFGAYNKAQAEKSAMNAQAEVADNNAQLAEWQAQDAMRRGATEEQSVRMRTASVKSTQRAALAANGVALDEGTALDVLATTDYFGDQDVQTVKDNARRTAWGYRTQGTGYKDNAANLRNGAGAVSPMFAGATSLIGSASSVASKWTPVSTSAGWVSQG